MSTDTRVRLIALGAMMALVYVLPEGLSFMDQLVIWPPFGFALVWSRSEPKE